MSTTNKVLSLRLLKALLHLFVGAAVLGVIHQYDTVSAGLLLFVAMIVYWSTYAKQPSAQRAALLLAGGFATGLFGVMAEYWGISFGHWVYHDLADERTFARWLPFAWMIAFIFLYRVEESLIRHLKIRSLKEKLILVAVLSAVLPTCGEIVAINFGVWTYAWDYQLLGVPLLAIILLMVFHTSIFLALTLVCRRYEIEDNVFGCSQKQCQSMRSCEIDLVDVERDTIEI